MTLYKRKKHTESKNSKAPENISTIASKSSQPKKCRSLSWNTLIFIAMALTLSAVCGGVHAFYMYTLHENRYWFSNIKEVEREISFRTECGLYYSYYKSILQAPSLLQGIHDLTVDTLTEHGNTVNILQRMNVYQEVFLAAIYRLLDISARLPMIFFYWYGILALQAVQLNALCITSCLLARSVLAAPLCAALFLANRLDTTRVEMNGPLRESFAMPMLALHILAVTIYLAPGHEFLSPASKRGVRWLLFGSCALFSLFWQFNQFVLLLINAAVLGSWLIGLIPTERCGYLQLVYAVSLLITWLLQFCAPMLLCSPALWMCVVTYGLTKFHYQIVLSHSLVRRTGIVLIQGLLVMSVAASCAALVKQILGQEDDTHIFQFLRAKLSGEEVRDFDVKLYLCVGAFDSLRWDFVERLSAKLLLPLYTPVHIALLIALLVYWCSPQKSSTCDSDSAKHLPPLLSRALRAQPELGFLSVCVALLAVFALFVMRLKLLWTPYMCVLTAACLAHSEVWKWLCVKLLGTREAVTVIVKNGMLMLLLLAIFKQHKPQLDQELSELQEFYDPDTVELMEWISAKTPKDASFTGSMQLLAGVKLCTGRAVLNHPHYEDAALRRRTQQLYEIYARKKPEDVHQMLKSYDVTYIILEDSICLAPARGDACRLGDLMDLTMRIRPDDPNYPYTTGLANSGVPRFCDEVRHRRGAYGRLFQLVLHNRTFRVYRVVQPAK